MKNTFLFLLFLSILNFSSCTNEGAHYLVNETREALTVELKFMDYGMDYIQSLQIRTKKNSGKKIKYRTFQEMNEIETNYDKTDNSIQFILGKDEFAFIGEGSDYNTYYGLREFSAKGENTFIEIKDVESNQDENQNIKMNFKTDSFLGYALIGTLTIE